MKYFLILLGIAMLPLLLLYCAVSVCAKLPRRRGRADCLFVLGARIHPDGSMSQTLKNRCETALRVWRDGVGEVIFLCGGQCTMDPCPEAWVMRAFFRENGVPEEKLILEDASTNTIENLRNALRIMEARGYRRAAMVTSDYHLTRALWIARDVGLDAWGIAAPSRGSLRGKMRNRCRECFSWLLYFRRKRKKEI